MKQRIFILPFILGPVSAMGTSFSVYYDTVSNDKCNTFCNIPYEGEGCCPAENVVTTQAIAEKFMSLAMNRDEVFSGFKLPDETVLMDSAGNFKLSVAEINAKGLDSTVTLRTTNTCAQGKKNTNGVCVDVQAFESENVAYVDWTSVLNNTNGNSGYEIDASQIKDNGGKDCYYDRDFDIVIHWCPKNYSAIDYSYGGAHIAYGNNPVDWSALPCNQSTETYHYQWDGGKSLGTYTKNNVTQTEIVFPSATGWSPRGLYIVGYPEFKPNDNSFNNIPYYSLLKTIADNLVTEQSTTWGRARLGLPFNQLGVTDRIILNNKVNGYGDANANWQIWTCNGDIETVHMYAAWARNPIVDTANVGGEFKIYRTGLSNPDKGDAEYRYWCQESGATLNNAGAYNASCDLGKCSLDNLPGCATLEACTDISGAHWCFSGSTPSCMSSASGRSMCCNDNLDACTKESACTDVGGTWNGTSCVASSNSGGGNGGGIGGDIGGTYKCPVNIYTPTASQHITVSGPSQSAGTCTYTVSCADGYTNLTGGNATVTCNDQQSCDALSFTGYSCTAQTPTVTCPSVATLQSGAPDGITVTEGEHTTTQCKYTLKCPTNYTLNGPNSNGQITCTGSNCASVINGYSCTAPAPTFTCPAVNTDLQTPSNAVLTRTAQDLNAQTCTYRVSCDSLHAFPTGDTPVTISCSETSGLNACTTSALQNRINSAASNCLLKLTASACTAEFAEGDDAQAGTITGTLINNDTGCGFTANCDLLQCDSGTLGDEYCKGTKTCNTSQECNALVAQYANVSCANITTCPDAERVSAVLVPQIANANRISKDVGTTGQNPSNCYYTLTCGNGYNCSTNGTCNANCSKSNCKESLTWWRSMACTPTN